MAISKKTPKIKDSGKRQQFDTGSKRDTREGKGRFDLLPLFAEEELAKHFEGGAVKYGDNNWLKGQPLSRYADSARRHLNKHLRGQRDEPHLVAAIWNLYCMLDTQKRIEIGLLPEALNDLLPELPQEIEDKLCNEKK
jgi:hypothetical protein